ncbi:hypothetical protein E2P81_ATG00640 [Venturia nashicola]|uniref:Uncharacterized protein n=1 Tax=Venturia nashicola TaxID=86259 RepID=A0A4Z1PH14_9PEZI|nr:hypothetical protein E6O75_ATG00653 [Venturia nashicola]TLD39653.1 hypothetical protein E2P81_ATG00640 [Venturia nashicola]
MYLPPPSLTPPSPSSQNLAWSPSATITTKQTSLSLPPVKYRKNTNSRLRKTSCALLRRKWAQSNTLIKTQDVEILNLELDNSDLLLTNQTLALQLQGLRRDNEILESEVVLLQKDVKYVTKQHLKEITKTDKLCAQLTRAIQTIRGLEEKECRLEKENIELLVVTAGLERDRRDDAAELESLKTKKRRGCLGKDEREMEIIHCVRALEYALSVRNKEVGAWAGGAKAFLRRVAGFKVG